MKLYENILATINEEVKSMAKVKSTTSSSKMRPALNPEAREQQLISLAVDLAEQQLRDGTASSQVISHYLKQSTVKAQLELEKLRQETEMLKAKTKSLNDSEDSKKMYEEALRAMRHYSGQGDADEY